MRTMRPGVRATTWTAASGARVDASGARVAASGARVAASGARVDASGARVAATITVAFVLAIAGPSYAQDLSDIPAAFVDVGTGARAMGAGGAVVAADLGPESLFWNPAGIAPGRGSTEALVTHGEQMGLVPYSAAAASRSLGSGLVLGAALLHSGDEVMTETTMIIGAARGVSPAPWCAGDEPVRAGVVARARRATFGDNESTEGQVTGSATGFGVDVGLLVPLTDRATLGIVGRDVLNTLSWDSSASGSYSENVPAGLTLGLRTRPHEAVSVELDVDKSLRLDNPDRALLGVNLELWGVAWIRGGYRRTLAAGGADEYTAGAGASVRVGSVVWRVDVAYLFGELDDTMRFALGLDL